MALAQQPVHRACIFLVSWNNTEKISHLSPPALIPFQDEEQPITSWFCPATRDRMVQQSEQQLRLISILSGSQHSPPPQCPSTACSISAFICSVQINTGVLGNCSENDSTADTHADVGDLQHKLEENGFFPSPPGRTCIPQTDGNVLKTRKTLFALTHQSCSLNHCHALHALSAPPRETKQMNSKRLTTPKLKDMEPFMFFSPGYVGHLL